MSDRKFTQRFNVVMTSSSSDKKITVQQCYICGERCDCSLTYLFKQIVSHGIQLHVQASFFLSNNHVMMTSKRCVKFLTLDFYFEMFNMH